MPLLFPKYTQFFDSNGDPLASGTLTFYQTGTTTPISTYNSGAYSTANENPLTLNADGRPSYSGALIEVWVKNLAGVRVVLKNSAGTTISDDDPMGDTTIPITLDAVDDGTAADLKSTEGAFNKQIAITRGYYSVGDGGHGMYRWDSASTATDDGGTILQVSGVTTGRWKLVYSGEINILQFGAKADDSTSNNTPFANARAFIAGATNPPRLTFAPGIYRYSTSPNWAIQDAEYVAQGEVRLRYTGTGNALIFDGGANPGAGIYNVKAGHFIVEAPTTANNGVYCRAMHQCKFSFKILGAGGAYSGLRTEWCVCSDFHINCSINHEGWYTSAAPAFGVSLHQRSSGETTSYCNFYDTCCEGVTDTGIVLAATLGNNFYGGTAENCDVYGIHAQSGSNSDKIFGMDYEDNTTADIFCQGNDIAFYECDSTNLVSISSSSNRCRLVGGLHSDITVDGTASAAVLDGCKFNRLNDSSVLTESATRTKIHNVINASNDIPYGYGVATYDPGSLVDGAGVTTTVTANGAALGDLVLASFSLDLQGITLTAYVSSANTVSVRFQNESTSTIDLSSGTLKVQAFRN